MAFKPDIIYDTDVSEGIQFIGNCLFVVVFFTILINLGTYLLFSTISLTRYFLSVILYRNRKRCNLDEGLIRQRFYAQRSMRTPTYGSHTHPHSAAVRGGALAMASDFATSIGLSVWDCQMSKSSKHRGNQGRRTYHFAKDINVEPLNSSVEKDHLVTLIDVDYYVDMPRLLVQAKQQPVFLFTHVPEFAGYSGPEYCYSFDDNQAVTFTCQGGASYTHKLWNYHTDNMVVRCNFFLDRFPKWSHIFLWVLVFPICAYFSITKCYLVDRKRVDQDSQVILLTPTAQYRGLLSIIFDWLISGPRFSRFEPVTNGFVHFKTYGKSLLHCIGKPGICSGSTLDANTFLSIKMVSELSKNPITISQVQSYKVKRDRAPVVTSFFRAATSKKPPVIIAPQNSINHYTWNIKDDLNDAKESLTPFMSPIVSNLCYAPRRTPSNDERAVKERVEKLQEKMRKEGLVKSPFMSRLIGEFISFFPKHTLDPSDEEEAFDKMKRPTQRHKLEIASTMGWAIAYLRRVRAFMKNEAYANVNDPRVISTINCKDKLDYSLYTYPVSEMFKKDRIKYRWYAFGLSGLHTAQRITEICSNADEVILTDFSRFDGRVSPLIRDMERALMLRLYKPEYHNALLDLLSSQYGLRGRMGEAKYELGSSRASGSPETSLLNTITNAFIAYAALRSSRDHTGKFVRPKTAWANLGIYGGDDGLTADISPKIYEKTAADWGHVLEAETIKRGEFGVQFLSRFYSPHVWYGETDSCCDIKRQLAKFHTTGNLPASVSCTERLVEKSRGYYCTDANTPIIGQFVTKVVELSGEFDPQTDIHRLRSYASLAPRDTQYPNVNNGDWMLEVVERQFSVEGLDTGHFTKFIAEAETLTDMLSPPLIGGSDEMMLKDPRTPVDINGNVWGSEPPANARISKKTPPKNRNKNKEKDISEEEIPERYKSRYAPLRVERSEPVLRKEDGPPKDPPPGEISEVDSELEELLAQPVGMVPVEEGACETYWFRKPKTVGIKEEGKKEEVTPAQVSARRHTKSKARGGRRRRGRKHWGKGRKKK